MRTRPMAKLAAVGLVGALALTGCGSSDKKSDSGLSGGSSGGSSSNSYTIAFQGPLSSDNQQLGINEVNGVQLAIDQANKDTSLGFKLKLLKADDGGVPEKAPAAAAQVLQDSTVMGVVGPSFSGASQAVGKKYGDAGLAIVNPSASNGELQDQGFKTWHRVMPNDYAEGPAAADWLAKKAKKVIVVSDKTPDDIYQHGQFPVVARSHYTQRKLETSLVTLAGAEETLLSPIDKTGGGKLYSIDPRAVSATLEWLRARLGLPIKS